VSSIGSQADTLAAAAGFRIAVATCPNPDSGLRLSHELDLLKPGLIYGDQVTLYSPAALLTASFAQVAYADHHQRLGFLREFAPALGHGPDLVVELEGLAALMAQYEGLPRAQRRKLAGPLGKVRRELNAAWQEIQQNFEDQIGSTPEGEQLADALDAGVLVIDPLLDPAEAVAGEDDQLLLAFTAALGGLLTDRQAYPLFDDATNDLVRAGVAEGMFSTTEGQRRRGQQAAAAAGFLGYLPTFPTATVRELLDIRKELETPLVRFRAAIVGVAGTLSAAAYEEGFAEQLHQAWVGEVAPALQELAERAEDAGIRRQLAASYLQSPAGPVGAALAIGIGSVTRWPALATAAAPALYPALKTAWEASTRQRDLARQDFYLLHHVDRRLSGH
jgi:hypothetical protein